MADLTKRNFSRVEAITLDLDDTLWPVAPTIASAEQDLLEWLSAHAPKTAELTRQSDIKQAIRQKVMSMHQARSHDLGFLRREMLRESLCRAGDDPSLADMAYVVFDTARQRVTLYQGVQEALARLALKFRLVAISNGTANVFLTPAGPYFAAAFSAHEVGVAKPDAKIYHAATTYLGLKPELVLHIGDDAVADVLGAKEAGLQTAWINPEGKLWADQSPQPWTVRNIAEVAQYLQV